MPRSSKSCEFLNRPLRYLIIYGSVFLFAFLVWSATEARKNTSNRVIDWLPKGSEELKKFYDYYWLFPEGELLMVSWEGCHRNDERLDEVASRLISPAPGHDQAYFKRVMTTRSVLQQLTGSPLELTSSKARSRMAGWMIGQNEEDACLVAMISLTGEKHRTETIDYVFQTVEEIVKRPRSEIYIAGPTIDSVAIDTISEQSQKMLLPFFLIFCFAMLLLCLKKFFAAAILFVVALMNEELGGTLLYWTGAHVDSISMLISSLIYVLTISGGVHIVNYYRETLQETDEHNAPWEMLKKALLPCSLAVITTIFGFESLAVSRMVPIRTFGLYASAALLLGTIWLFIFLSSVLQQYPIRSWKKSTDARKMSSRNKYWKRLGIFVGRYQFVISIGAVTLMVVLCFGLKFLKTTVTFHGMFPETSKVIRDYEKLENTVGGLIPIEVMLRVPETENEQIDFISQIYLLKELRNELSKVDGVDAVVSAMNFVPDLPPQKSRRMADSARRTAINSMIRHNREQLEETGFFIKTEKKSAEELALEGYDPYAKIKYEESPAYYWRLSLRVSSRYPNDYNVLLASVSDHLEQARKNDIASPFKDLQFTVTGGVPLVHRAQEQLLSDLIKSFVSAFGLIALTMILLLRGVGRGLLAMIPNLFPCVIVFGALGWLQIPVDMGTMMTASVAMGISVDGTIHYLTWFNIGMRKGLTRQHAVFYAYRNCATALFQTMLICGVGMLVFGVSEFIPISRFAILLCILLIASFIGDIIVLPAILLSPVGKIFNPKNNKSIKSSSPVCPESEQHKPV